MEDTMPNITMLDIEQLRNTKLRPYIDKCLEHRAPDPGFHAMMGHNIDLCEAMFVAWDSVFNKGRIEQLGTPREVYEQPGNQYVATQLGTPPINLIPVDLLPAPQAPREARIIGARTEQLRIGVANGSANRAVLRWVEHLGDQNHLHLEIGDQKLTTLADPHSRWKAGDAVSLELVNPLYFNDAGVRIDAKEGKHA
jgi:multiple sugar transport system ATP-binding protein